jgi:hypothetical protein
MVLCRQKFLIVAVMLALEDLHIGECMAITLHAMPCLKHLRITNVGLTRPMLPLTFIDELRTFRMSCHICSCSSTKPPYIIQWPRKPTYSLLIKYYEIDC